jgi:hypothetical protein
MIEVVQAFDPAPIANLEHVRFAPTTLRLAEQEPLDQNLSQALVLCPIKEIFFGGTRGGGKADAQQQATSILPPLNVKTARS